MYANMLFNAWPTRLTSMLKTIFNASDITMRNGATGATGTAYMALCELPCGSTWVQQSPLFTPQSFTPHWSWCHPCLSYQMPWFP